MQSLSVCVCVCLCVFVFGIGKGPARADKRLARWAFRVGDEGCSVSTCGAALRLHQREVASDLWPFSRCALPLLLSLLCLLTAGTFVVGHSTEPLRHSSSMGEPCDLPNGEDSDNDMCVFLRKKKNEGVGKGNE